MSLDTAGVSTDSLFPKGAILLLCKEGQIVLMFILHIYHYFSLEWHILRRFVPTSGDIVFNLAATRGPSSCMFADSHA